MWKVWQERSHGSGLPDKKLVRSVRLTQWEPTLTGEVVPPKRRQRTPLEEATLAQQTAAWCAEGVVERAPKLVWVNNTVLVPKKNGTMRACLDCRPANAVTQDFDWPLPRLQDLRFRTKGATWFTRLDLRNAFFRIGVPEKWRYLLGYEVGGQCYWFKRMPFGAKTAPATFQRFMDHGLASCRDFSFWYIDDVLVYASSLRELRQRLVQVRKALERMKVEVNEDKSEYEQRSLLFAGIWVYGRGVGPNLVKAREALAIPSPRTKKEQQSALGLVSYLRDYIPLASAFTARLHARKDDDVSPVEYEAQWGRLMRHISRALCTLGHWSEEEEADLYTDASGLAAAAVLIQQGRIVAVASRKLTPTEMKYSTTDREHLSILLAAQRFRIFLHRRGSVTRVHNDHWANMSRKTDNMTPRQTRWFFQIDQWIPHVRHVRGIDNPADFFSRWGLENWGGAVRT